MDELDTLIEKDMGLIYTNGDDEELEYNLRGIARLKSFITTQIAAAEQRGRDMAVEYILQESEKANDPFPLSRPEHDDDPSPRVLYYETLEEARSNRPTV